MTIAGDINANGPLHVAVVDNDSGFLQVLVKRMDALEWRHRVSPGPLPADALVAMRVDALVVDLAVLGHTAWEYLEDVCTRLPHLGVVVCTGRSTVAQRVRGLRMGADDWMTKPCHPEEVIARAEAVVRRRRVADSAVGEPALEAGELTIRTDQFQAFAAGRGRQAPRREVSHRHPRAALRGP